MENPNQTQPHSEKMMPNSSSSRNNVSEVKIKTGEINNGIPGIEGHPEGNEHPTQKTHNLSISRKITSGKELPMLIQENSNAEFDKPVISVFSELGELIDVNRVSMRISKSKVSIAPSRKSEKQFKMENEDSNHHSFIEKPFYSKGLAILATKYYETVTFRQECYIMFIFLVPLVLIVVALFFLDSIVFESKSTALMAKIAIVVGGVIAFHVNDTINERHGRLSGMAEIINHKATLQSICGTVCGHNKTISFYACLIAAEFSLTTIYVKSEYGTGISLDMNVVFNTTELPSYSGLLLSAVGSQFACSNCGGVRSLDVLLVPVTNKLKGGVITNITSTHHGGIELLAKSIQDILSVEASCIDVKQSNTVLNDNQILLDIEEANSGIGASMYILHFSANTVNKERKSTLVVREYSGSTLVRYGLSPSGGTVRHKAESVESIFLSTCSKIGDTCLDQAKRTGLADALMNMVFSQKSYVFNQRLAYSSNVAPDPSAPGSDRIFEENVQKLIGNALIIAASMVPSKEIPVNLHTDTIQVKLIVNQWLLILTVVIASIAALFPMMLISTDLIRIKKSPDRFLRLLYERVKPGKEFIEDSAVLCTDLNEGQQTALIKYGEDRKTVSNGLGVLRFGLKHEIVKYHENRAYY